MTGNPFTPGQEAVAVVLYGITAPFRWLKDRCRKKKVTIHVIEKDGSVVDKEIDLNRSDHEVGGIK